jgi:hypothetical protein
MMTPARALVNIPEAFISRIRCALLRLNWLLKVHILNDSSVEISCTQIISAGVAVDFVSSTIFEMCPRLAVLIVVIVKKDEMDSRGGV